LYGINENPGQSSWTSSPKVYAEFYIDDCALGVPLSYPSQERPFVDWMEIVEYLFCTDLITEEFYYKYKDNRL